MSPELVNCVNCKRGVEIGPDTTPVVCTKCGYENIYGEHPYFQDVATITLTCSWCLEQFTRDEKGRFKEKGTSGGGALGGAIAGGALGSAWGPGGTIAGAIFGAILGDALEENAQENGD